MLFRSLSICILIPKTVYFCKYWSVSSSIWRLCSKEYQKQYIFDILCLCFVSRKKIQCRKKNKINKMQSIFIYSLRFSFPNRNCTKKKQQQRGLLSYSDYCFVFEISLLSLFFGGFHGPRLPKLDGLDKLKCVCMAIR